MGSMARRTGVRHGMSMGWDGTQSVSRVCRLASSNTRAARGRDCARVSMSMSCHPCLRLCPSLCLCLFLLSTDSATSRSSQECDIPRLRFPYHSSRVVPDANRDGMARYGASFLALPPQTIGCRTSH
ncbi:hypothetical protein K431DRAFT_83378 [Polychaeton citri CBS 116435]|uniref:Uncharacterized protein n=1 Tax=Polychaeton citri CBS 116435 TaxID=1314669 RepID=A0A9P4Q5I4_9PEZI|nr:hypothetical protein K431DRAFT_83378 [Polychaeton citri CBS 116435]